MPPMSGIMGSSLVSRVLRQPSPPGTIAVSELFSVGHSIRALRTLEWKFTDHMSLKLRYYVNLEKDPGELQLHTDLTKAPGRRFLDRYLLTSRDLAAWRARMAAHADRSTIPDDVLK